MILVDTSILIGYFRGIEGEKYDFFDNMLRYETLFGVCPYIYQELLQGAKTNVEFITLKKFLSLLPVYDLQDGLHSFEKAALLNFRCRRKGVTIRSTIDLLIAQTAIENNLELFCNDKDFENMATVITELHLFKGNDDGKDFK